MEGFFSIVGVHQCIKQSPLKREFGVEENLEAFVLKIRRH